MIRFAKRIALVGLIVLFLSLYISVVHAKEDKAVAVVSNIKGKAKISKHNSKKWKRLEIFMELHPGDKISVFQKSSVSIVFYHDTHTEVIKGFSKVSIAFDKCKSEAGSKKNITQKTPYKGIKTFQSIKVSSEKFAGISRGSEAMYLEYPLGLITTRTPAFKWRAFKGAEKYLLTIVNINGNPVADAVVKTNKTNFPQGTRPLSFGGAYFWSVKALKDNIIIAKGSEAFRVLNKPTWEKMRILEDETEKQLKNNPNDTSPYVVRIAFFMEYDLIDKAIATCALLQKKKPNDKSIKRWMEKLKEIKCKD